MMANEVRLIDANALQKLLLPIAIGLEKEYGSLGGAIAGVMQHVDAAPTIDPESLRPKGQWVVNRKNFDGYEHHRCSHCGTDAPFAYTYRDDWDEGMDGEYYYLGQIDDGIEEQMGFYCPNCGADMREGCRCE